jgi:4-hydroxy-3-methylbut-2-enyl diphosphate reductase
MPDKAKRHILLCAPRGFCAGVERAVLIVEEALRRFGARVYVRHEIVPQSLRGREPEAKAPIFVKELDEIPADKAAGRFLRPWRAQERSRKTLRRARCFFLDAICPLVSKCTRRRSRITGAAA